MAAADDGGSIQQDAPKEGIVKSPWERAKEQRYVSQEKRTSRKPGARPQINSGRKWHSLRDVIQDSPLGRMLIDNKTTEGASYRITITDFRELKRDANRTPPGCHPALQVDIQEMRLMIIEDALWDEIIDYIRILENPEA